MKNSNDTIRNRTSDLPICSTALPEIYYEVDEIKVICEEEEKCLQDFGKEM